MPRWQRPYRLGSDVWFGAAQVAVSSVLAPLLIAAASDEPVAFVVFLALVAAGFAADGVRRTRLGVYVSDAGIRSRSAKGTAQVTWPDVAGIRSGEATFRGIDRGREAIYLDLADGSSVQTAVLCRPDYGRFGRLPRFGRVRYWPDEYDEILTTLQAAWRERLADPAPVGVVEQPASPPAAAVKPARPAWHRAAAELDNERQVLARKHRRGELTDDEYAVAVARLRER